jgi:hypothetical protein
MPRAQDVSTSGSPETSNYRSAYLVIGVREFNQGEEYGRLIEPAAAELAAQP